MPVLELPRLAVRRVAATIAEVRPVLVNRDPGPDEAGVPLGWTIALEVVDPGPDGVDRAASLVWVDDVPAFDGATTAGVLPGFDGPRAQVVETADTLRIVLDPVVPFASQAVVRVRAVSATVGGLFAIDDTYQFIAEDRTAPVVVAAQAVGPRTVRIGFDEPVIAAGTAGFAFEVLDAPAVPVSVVAASADGEVVEVELDTELTPDARYRVTVINVTDTSGNPVAPPYNWAELVGFRPAQPAARRFDLWSMLPKHNRREDATGDLWRFIACLQEVADQLLAEVDRFPDIFDIERAPAPFLDLVIEDLGNPFTFDLSEIGKRRLASVLVEMYRQKGTAVGIRNAIRFFLGLEVEILPFAADTLVLGESELGVDWILGPSSRFALYAFNVRVDLALTDEQRRQLRAIVEYLKPAHTHLVDLLEPAPAPSYDHWELGESELGVESDLH